MFCRSNPRIVLNQIGLRLLIAAGITANIVTLSMLFSAKSSWEESNAQAAQAISSNMFCNSIFAGLNVMYAGMMLLEAGWKNKMLALEAVRTLAGFAATAVFIDQSLQSTGAVVSVGVNSLYTFFISGVAFSAQKDFYRKVGAQQFFMPPPVLPVLEAHQIQIETTPAGPGQ